MKGPEHDDSAPARSLHRGTSTHLHQTAGRRGLEWAAALAGVLAIAAIAMVVSSGDGAASELNGDAGSSDGANAPLPLSLLAPRGV